MTVAVTSVTAIPATIPGFVTSVTSKLMSSVTSIPATVTGFVTSISTTVAAPIVQFMSTVSAPITMSTIAAVSVMRFVAASPAVLIFFDVAIFTAMALSDESHKGQKHDQIDYNIVLHFSF